MGSGFLIALFVLGGIREIFGSRTLLGMQVMPDFYEPWLIMILPAGAFLTLGLLMGFSNAYAEHKKKIEKGIYCSRIFISKSSIKNSTGELVDGTIS